MLTPYNSTLSRVNTQRHTDVAGTEYAGAGCSVRLEIRVPDRSVDRIPEALPVPPFPDPCPAKPQARAHGRVSGTLKGAEIADVARHLEVSEQTYHRWRNQYGGLKANDVKRLKELERENSQLKQIVADKELENLALREVAKGNW